MTPLAQALQEATHALPGARFTLRRALAIAPTDARTALQAAILCQDADSATTVLRGLLDGARVAFAGAPDDAHGMTLVGVRASAGCVHFTLPASLRASPHLAHHAHLLLSALKLFDAFARLYPGKAGEATLSLGFRQPWACLAFGSNREDAALLPDFHFVDSMGHATLRRALARVAPWEERPARAFWRGARDRLGLCALAAQANAEAITPLFDVAEGAVPALPPACRYVIDTDDGIASSASLFQKLLSGAVLLRVTPGDSTRNWFYDRLVAWRHYVPVRADLGDLLDQMDWLGQNDAEAIARNGREMALAATYEAERRVAARRIAELVRE